ncbi:sulfite exporter TauE/SafE family protein [Rhodococcus sp. HNM0569]|nr:sulfite exporter TauE/SafE family protein [Rhodococcus sp. HNM0569]NLU84940.1 sulfite exporter TauE/SafE family protein [Rhodococcus sp. HNM0569]
MLATVTIGSFAAAGLGASLGMAGGIFVVPLLTVVAGLPFAGAVAVSLVSVVACSCAGSPALVGARLVNIRLAIVLGIAAALGALTGLLAVDAVPERALYGLFAVVLAVSAAQMLRARGPRDDSVAARGKWATRLRLHSSVPDGTAGETPYTVARPGAGLAAMFGAGVLSTLLGIGSGVLKIPAMDMALRLPLKVSSATATLMIGVTTAGAAAAVLVHGAVDLAFAAPVVLGSVGGSVLGARLLVRANPSHLRVLFFGVLVAVAVPMTFAAFGSGLR